MELRIQEIQQATEDGCVSTQRHKRVSNVGFANRDFTSLSLKKTEAQGRFKPSPSCRVHSTSFHLKSTPFPTTPLGQSLKPVELRWPHSTSLDQFMGV